MENIDSIAIVGVGCKLPGGVETVDDLFLALRDGRDCITEVPPDRWDVNAYYDPDPLVPGKTYVRHGGFVDGIDHFDAAFFGISDVEAKRMDPQQRIALSTVWRALEDAGQSPSELMKTNTGVFLAMMNTNGYSQLKGAFEGMNGVTGYDAMSDAMSITAGRISHFLGVEGPCLTVDTACSGSMVALHLARQSILAGECDAAIVLGTGAILHPGIHVAFSKVGLMSRTGRCMAFDERADGYVRSEGCVAALIRRESIARERGDRIMARILTTTVNQDGRTPAVTAPNGDTQEKVIRMALARTGVSPEEVGYVEAHGTGTPVGDPIEMGALVNVYGPGRSRDQPLYVGSAKSNFGHIEPGAGLLGVVKAAVSLDRQTVFPSLHFNRLNPNIDTGHAPLEVPTRAIPWPRDGERRRMAGVNSFGYSGTNAHTLLAEAPVLKADRQAAARRPTQPVLLSARTPEDLERLAIAWADHLEHVEPAELGDVAFTSAMGRAHLRFRLAAVGDDPKEIASRVRKWAEGRSPQGLYQGTAPAARKPKIAFVFTGQGAQYPAMGRELYEHEPTFRAAIDRCAALMDASLGVPLTELLMDESRAAELENTRFVQPALFAIEYALAELLRTWGIEPDAVMGHSVGEIVAGWQAGVLTLEDAVRFVLARGALMGGLPSGGRMLAVEAEPDSVAEWLDDHAAAISIAAVNGPHSVVVSGEGDVVELIDHIAQAEGYRTTTLGVSHAFHSPLMDPILDELRAVGDALRTSRPRIPMVSNLTGAFHGDEIPAGYWADHVRQPVMFHSGVVALAEAKCSLVVEVGPHPTLTAAITGAVDGGKVRCQPTLVRNRRDVANILGAVAGLHVRGAAVDFDRLFWDATYRRVRLPHYPLRKDRHWIDVDLAVDGSTDHVQALHPVLGRRLTHAPRRSTFELKLTAAAPWADHRVLGVTVFPATGYLEMASRALAVVNGQEWTPALVRDVAFSRPLVLNYRKSRSVRIALAIPAAGGSVLQLSVSEDGDAATYCQARVTALPSDAADEASEPLDGREAELRVAALYGEMRKVGLEYGANFATIREIWTGRPGSGTALARITASPHDGEPAGHPFAMTTMLDGCLQVTGAALRTLPHGDLVPGGGAFIPVSIAAVEILREPQGEVWSHVSLRLNSEGTAAVAAIQVFDAQGRMVVTIDGLELRRRATLPEDGAAAAPVRSAPARLNGSAGTRANLLAQLRDAPEEERVAIASYWLTEEIKDTLGQAAEEIDLDSLDPSTAFVEIGLDSLLVTELQRRIQEKLDFRFDAMEALDYQSIESLAEYALEKLLGPKGQLTKAG